MGNFYIKKWILFVKRISSTHNHKLEALKQQNKESIKLLTNRALLDLSAMAIVNSLNLESSLHDHHQQQNNHNFLFTNQCLGGNLCISTVRFLIQCFKKCKREVMITQQVQQPFSSICWIIPERPRKAYCQTQTYADSIWSKQAKNILQTIINIPFFLF